MRTPKIGIVGAGAVGAASISALIDPTGVDPEIVVVNRNHKRAIGLAEDFAYAAALRSKARVRAGHYEDLAGSDLIMINAGVNERDGGATDRSDSRGRLKLIPANAKVYADVIPQIAAAAPTATLLVVTDPPDPLAEVARALAPDMHVVSTGTVIDSLRFRYRIAEEFDVQTDDVKAMVVGEHGTSAVSLWSTATIGDSFVEDLIAKRSEDPEKIKDRIRENVKYSNISIIEGIGASQHGIGAVTALIGNAIVRDDKAVLPVAAYNDEFGTTLGLPSVLGAAGVDRVLMPAMSDEERAALDKSAEVLRTASARALEEAGLS